MTSKKIDLLNEPIAQIFKFSSQIFFWDTRSKSSNNKKKELDLPMNVPQTFKHLGNWRPLLKVSLPCSDPGGDFAPTKFSISERQGDKSTSNLNQNILFRIQFLYQKIILS